MKTTKYRDMVITALERAGMSPSETQMEGLVVTFARVQETLEEVRALLDASTQPAVSFGWPSHIATDEDDHVT